MQHNTAAEEAVMGFLEKQSTTAEKISKAASYDRKKLSMSSSCGSWTVNDDYEAYVITR